MTTQQTLAYLIRESQHSVLRFTKGVDDSNALRQAPNLPNHLVWTLGHLALTLARSAARLDGVPPAESDFLDGPTGDAQRFGTKSVGFGSQPSTDAAIYPPLARAIAIFEASIQRLADAIEQLTDEGLNAQVPWRQATISASSMIGRLVFHNGTHAGQIIDLRRALGLGTIVG